LDIARDPEGQDSFEAFGAREVSDQPDFFEGFEDGGLGVERNSAWSFGFCLSEAFKFPE